MKKPYKIADCAQISSGFAVMLDGRQAATPMGDPLVVPDAPLAEAIALEWRQQGGLIRKETMKLTQIACIALDLAEAKSAELVADILSYGETDLICYRAGDAPELLVQQAELLGPLLEWAGEAFGVALLVTDGVMPVRQPHGNHARLALALAGYDRWKLAALAACIKPLGSLILALALVEGRIGGEEAFRLSHLEELHAANKWGGDEENEKRLAALQEEIMAVENFLRLLMSSGNGH